PLLLAGIAALAWAVFCAQLGKARERLFFRLSVFAAAFVLGVMSVELTDLLILVEESKLHLVESGEPLRDFLFYTFGVGFREEISKLIMFAPLLPILRKHGKKSDVLVAGAFVGLGFAAVENILYLQSGDLTTAIGRFLTANFLHMAMTAILANALHEMMVKGDSYAPELSRTALMVMGMHGLYDFFIAHPKIGGGYLSMLVFFVLVNRFIVAIDMARGRSEPNEKLLDTFVLGIAVVLSAGFVWASILVGPTRAAMVSGEGILGSAILMVVFAQRFRSM
ncbi:MAG: PrsW family glutamic-type intramembrane protease, partial [Polyangiaceae bacterium]